MTFSVKAIKISKNTKRNLVHWISHNIKCQLKIIKTSKNNYVRSLNVKFLLKEFDFCILNMLTVKVS